MKKVLVVSSLVLITAFSYATKVGGLSQMRQPTGKSAIGFHVFNQNKISAKPKIENDFSCTVTVTGQVGVGSTNISVSCAASAASCDAAASQAVGCVRSTIKAVKALL
jgi:hypothetical protein